MREGAEAGESVAPAETLALLDEFESLRRQLRQPTELHITAQADVDAPGHWIINHPLLSSAISASDPASALVLAAVELRRVLHLEAPRASSRSFHRVARAEWEALAAETGPAAEALSSALRALTRAESDLDELRARQADHQLIGSQPFHATAPEREAARRRLQESSLSRLARANVEGFARSWAPDGFGASEDYSVPLLTLVLATRTRVSDRDLSWRFDGGRRWLALEHRVSDGISSDSLVLIATVIQPDPEADRSLRQIPLQLAGRSNTISHLRAYAETIASLFGEGVSVDDQRGPVGGGCWPLDVSSIEALTGGEVTRDGLDAWIAHADELAFLPVRPYWELLWLGDAPERW
jgi:hypothetical protein